MVESAEDMDARRAARAVGLHARKGWWLGGLLRAWRQDFDGFQLFDPKRLAVVAGQGFDMTAEDVIEWCGKEAAKWPVPRQVP